MVSLNRQVTCEDTTPTNRDTKVVTNSVSETTISTSGCTSTIYEGTNYTCGIIN